MATRPLPRRISPAIDADETPVVGCVTATTSRLGHAAEERSRCAEAQGGAARANAAQVRASGSGNRLVAR